MTGKRFLFFVAFMPMLAFSQLIPTASATGPVGNESLERLFDDLFAEVGKIEKIEDRTLSLNLLLDAMIAAGQTEKTMKIVQEITITSEQHFALTRAYNSAVFGTVARGRLLNGDSIDLAWEMIEKGKEYADNLEGGTRVRNVVLRGMLQLYAATFIDRFSRPVPESEQAALFEAVERLLGEIEDADFSDKLNETFKNSLAMVLFLNGGEELAVKLLDDYDDERLWNVLYRPYVYESMDSFYRDEDEEINFEAGLSYFRGEKSDRRILAAS